MNIAHAQSNPYETGLDRNPANYAPLTPLTLIERAAYIYPERTSVVNGIHRYTWAETYERCRRLASALDRRGVGVGDTVAVVAPNVPAIYEATFGVAMTGAVLNTINTRLDAKIMAFIMQHSETRVLITDKELHGVVAEALGMLDAAPLVIDIDDPGATGGELIGELTYEAFLEEGDPGFEWRRPDDEWRAISLNYTSGTTGDPKGVVYHHRGAYLNALGNAIAWSMPHHPVYLWTLPMFHCNGWCFPWTLAALAGTSVCLRKVAAKAIYDAIADEGVTHLCGAPIVWSFLLNAPADERREFDHVVEAMTAAAPPPAAVLEQMEKVGFHMTHAYGLTETYGPASICAWKHEWDSLPMQEKADKKGRQGVRYPVLDGLDVMDPLTMEPVPRDGETIGEIMFRGNIVMKGYLKNPASTTAAFAGGWFHSGDLAVMHSDGYIQIKDRSKDVIISGGENISSIEVEDTLYRHPAVLEAAVVARADEKWGETPCAFITLKEDAPETTAEDIIAYCRENLARYKVPKSIVFGDLPKTSTGKIQKFVLRERAQELET